MSPRPRSDRTPSRGAGRDGRDRRDGRDGRPPRTGRPPVRLQSELGGDQVEGRRAVLELLSVGRRPVLKILMADEQEPSAQLDEIEQLAARMRVPLETVPRPRLDAQARTESPQGVLALARPLEPVPLEELCQPSAKGQAPFLLVAAGLTDPRNLGALLRSAECAGVTGVVLPRHRSVRLSPSVTKTAAGAIEHLDFAVVGGIPAALAVMETLGVWRVGLAGESSQSLYDLPLGEGAVALVVGNEQKGMAPLVRKRCDAVVSIPQHGRLPSLNVGWLAPWPCSEVARQRAALSPGAGRVDRKPSPAFGDPNRPYSAKMQGNPGRLTSATSVRLVDSGPSSGPDDDDDNNPSAPDHTGAAPRRVLLDSCIQCLVERTATAAPAPRPSAPPPVSPLAPSSGSSPTRRRCWSGWLRTGWPRRPLVAAAFDDLPAPARRHADARLRSAHLRCGVNRSCGR